jgi:NDP-sugar pyrophosphorylase family protein
LKALILAAGLGTRLHPYTLHAPKALVTVAGVTLLEHTITKLQSFGIHEFIINIHHFGEQIIDFLEQKNFFGAQILISDEREQLLDTGGGIKKALETLTTDENLLVHNVDIMHHYDLKKLMDQHSQSHAQVTLLTQQRNTSRYLLFDAADQLKGWLNQKTGETIPSNINPLAYKQLAYNGIHLVNQKALKYFPQEKSFPIIPVYLKMAQNEIIKSLEFEQEWWMDLGKPEALTEAENFLKR